MKKLLSGLLAIALFLQAGMFAATAESTEKEKLMVTLSNVSVAVLSAMPDTGIRGNSRNAFRDLVLSGRDIAVENGKYSYLFRLRPNGTLVFDNDLTREYQGINDKYQLHYEIDGADRHNMITTGNFDHIITASPLLEKLSAEEKNWVLSNISEDSYFYQLVLREAKEFTFRNSLGFLYNSDRYGYAIDYRYDIPADRQTVEFNGSDATEQAIRNALADAEENLKRLLPGN